MTDKTFERELEFVQLLCNPDYLKWLFEQGYFEKESFIELLKHLEYWNKPEYKKYLTYPYCLVVLKLLNSPDICKKLSDESFYVELVNTQMKQWKENKPTK